MSQILAIPALKGGVSVLVQAQFRYANGTTGPKAEFKPDDSPHSEKLQLPPGDLDGGAVVVSVTIRFPPQNGKGKVDQSYWYERNVSAMFPIKTREGSPRFQATELKLQGPLPAGKQAIAWKKSPFQLLDAKAVVDPQDPMNPVIKVYITAGSPEGVTVGEETQKQKAQYEGGVEIGNDKIGKVSLGRGGEVDTKTSSVSRQLNLTQSAEWALYIEIPAKPAPPAPNLFRYRSTLSIYFESGKSEIGNYRHPQDKSDQIKELQKFMDRNLELWGEAIKGVYIHGYASRRGDTGSNINLAEARARHVASYITRLYHVQIPPNRIITRGEPLTGGNDSDDGWKDRYVEIGIDIEHVIAPQPGSKSSMKATPRAPVAGQVRTA